MFIIIIVIIIIISIITIVVDRIVLVEAGDERKLEGTKRARLPLDSLNYIIIYLDTLK